MTSLLLKWLTGNEKPLFQQVVVNRQTQQSTKLNACLRPLVYKHKRWWGTPCSYTERAMLDRAVLRYSAQSALTNGSSLTGLSIKLNKKL
jgi:hypothetical protein